jgi:hypothetical protein
MNDNCASYPKVSLSLGFKNTTKEDSYLRSATPNYPRFCSLSLTKLLSIVVIDRDRVRFEIAVREKVAGRD